MSALPQLVGEDVNRLESTLRNLVERTAATVGFVTDSAGFVIARHARSGDLDTMTLGALCANTYAASAAMAGLIGETTFSSVYQEGKKSNLLISALGDAALLVVLFEVGVSGDSVKYYASIAVNVLAAHLRTATYRAPLARIDLATLNVADPSELFRRKP